MRLRACQRPGPAEPRRQSEDAEESVSDHRIAEQVSHARVHLTEQRGGDQP